MTNQRSYQKIGVILLVVVIFLPYAISPNPNSFSNQDIPTNRQFSFIPAATIEDYVDSDSSDVDVSQDIGTHSNFASQQAGPDSTYDTLVEVNGAPPPTNSENDIDSDTPDLDSTPDQGVEGTFTNAQGSALDSSYFALNEESVISAYGGETGAVFVTGSVPDMAGSDQFCLYQAIFWNPTDDVYEVSRVEFSYTGSTWLKAVQQGSGLSFPTSGWSITSSQVAFWTSATPITVQPHTASSFYVRGDSNKIRTEYYIDIGITANSSTYIETYHSAQNRRKPAVQLWLGATSPPTQIHSVSTGVQSTVYVSLEEDDGGESILSGGTLTIDVPTEFTGITSVGGTNWGTATINGNQITVSNTAAIMGSYITYAFQITSPDLPGLYKLDIAFDDGSDAHPLANFTIHVTGTPPTVEKINLEYQWTTATYDDSFEEVCIYIGSHTGSENLAVNYWNGFTWDVLGTISTSGWSNFTATGLSSATYTIQLIGSSESSDSSKDTWNIDLITLHTWAIQTYNYKLDLEIQWSSANYTQDFEELCVYAGSLDTESIRIDIWTGVVWTNIATDLNANSWNNISIGTWLTSATLTIRFRGDLEVSDTSQSSWEIDCSLLHTWDNEVPTNSATPVISNLDDTTFLYAEYRQYQLTAEVTDLDGYAEIDYVELTLTSDDRLTEYWSVRFDEDTNLFTEQSDPSNYIVLDAGSSSAVKAGSTISATFFITINWDHPDVVNTDIKSEVFDANPSSSSDYFEVNWDIETRLDLSSGPTLNDGSGTITRGDLDGSMTASGTITYLGSSLHPSAADVDVWISSTEYGTQIGPWEATNYEDVGGTFSVAVYADDQVGIDDYTFKSVTEGAGASGADQFSASQTEQYISDRIQVQSYSSDDSRINVNTTASLHAVLYYDYDNSFVTDGSVTINGITATYSGSNGIWNFVDEKSTAQLVTYDTLVYSGGVHGITVEDQNGQSVNQVWDCVKVVSYSAADARVNVNANAIIDVTLIYEYDSSFVVDGTVTINGASATHQGVGVWRITVSSALVQGVTYNLVVASGNAYEITLVDQNSQSQLVVWDQVIVSGYSISNYYVNIDDSVNLDVILVYESDSAAVIDGSVAINLVSASHSGGGVWRITVSKSTVQGVTYNSVACSGNAFGISEVNQNSQSQLIIWDQIIVTSYFVTDSRVNVNDDVNIDVAIEYEYNGTAVTTGSVWINSILATHQSGGIWRISDTKASVQSFTYNSVTCSGNILGITSINQNSQSTVVIWDQITVRSYTVIDGRVNIDNSVNIDVLLEYEYDDTDVVIGSVTINTISAFHVGSGIWRITESKATVQSFTYDAIVCSGNTHGVTSVNQNGQSIEVIWDQVVVRSYTVLDDRVGINTAVLINFTLEYEYDDSQVTDGLVTLNGVSASHNESGVWQISISRITVQVVTYDTVVCSGNAFGISDVNQNSQSQLIIWDQIIVQSYSIFDDRVNIGDSVNIDVLLQYEYDNTNVTDGSVSINAISATHQVGGLWRIVETKATVQSFTYDTVVCSGNILSITSVNQNSQSGAVIWDQVTVRLYTVLDGRVNLDDSVNIDVLLEYEYDDTPVTDGTVTINTISATPQGGGVWRIVESKATVQSFTYDTIACSANAHGITSINQNSQSTAVIWDQVTVRSYTVIGTRVNIDDSVNIDVLLQYEYDDTAVTDGTVTINTISATPQGGGVWRIVETKSTVQSFTYDTVVCSGNALGITSVNQNGQSTAVIWDQVTVRSYTILDGRLNIDDSVNVDVWVQYEYDDTNITDGTVTINTISATYQSGGVWRIVETKSTVQSFTYDTVACSGNTLGITSVNQNSQSSSIIWDQITVRSYTVIDNHVNIDDSANIDVLLEYEFDDSPVLDGTVTINTISATHQGSGVWRIVETKTTVQSFTYDTVVCSGNAYGITDVNQNSQSSSVIWDQITVRSYTVVDGRVSTDDSVNIDVLLEYEYDDSSVTDGIVTINTISATHQGAGVWRIVETKSTVQLVTYDTVVCSGNTHGISSVNQNSQSTNVIWDQVTVRSYTVVDTRINTDDSVNIDVLLEYEYDDTVVADGTITINSISATYEGAGVWRIVDTKATVQSVTYDTVACSGNTHGVSSVDQNSQSTAVIWDQVTVRSYTVIDNRVNIDDNVNIDVLLEYEFDDTIVTDGTVTINTISATYQGAGIWRITQSQATVQSVSYDEVVCSGNAYGITEANQNGQSTAVIWDQVVVRSYSVSDNRIAINAAVNIDFTLEYDIDGTPMIDGIVALNGISATHQGAGVWRITQSRSSVQAVTYNSVVSSGNLHGIDSVDQNSQSQMIIWDQITVRQYDISDGRVNLDDSVDIDVTLEYEYDDTPVTDGTVTINGVGANHQGVGVWRISQSRATVQGVIFDTVACSGNTHGIASVDQNSLNQFVIWDQITVRSYTVIDSRVNIDDSVIIDVLLEYEYDNTPATDGTVTINTISATPQGAGVWRITESKATVQLFTYDTVVCSGNTYGISDVNQNSQSTSVIWDRIQVLTTTVDDGRINTDSSCEIRVTLMLEYDSALLGAGDTVTLNGVAMVWDGGDSRFELARQQSTVGDWTYFVNSSLETTYGISVFNLNSQEIIVIWDQIRILTTVVDDGRVSIDSSVELQVTAELAYDGHLLASGDTIVMDSASMTWDGVNTWFDLSRVKSTVGLWNFQVDSASETTYGITVIDLNGQSQDVIWDQLSINIVADLDSVNNGVQVNFTMTVTYEYDSTVCTTYSLKIARNSTHWHTFTNINVTSFVDTNSDVSYLYTTTIVSSESTYGITVFSTNIETVEWGAGTAAPVNSTAPVITNPNDSNFMYAKLRFYIITSNVSDAQGYTDIDYVELSLWDNSRSVEIWRIRFTESTNTFSVMLGSDYIQLSGSTYTKSGFDIDITWSIKIDWDHQDLSTIDFKQYVVDSGTDSDENWYEADYNVETRLDYSVSPSLSDTRGDLDTSDLECTGTVIYYGSVLHPLANETDVWVLRDVSGTWSSNVDLSGDFTVSTIGSSSSVRLNTYTVKVVTNGDGASGTDLFYTASETTEFITDRIEFYLSGTDSARVNIGDGGTIWWNARYDYDNTEIVGGLTAQLNGSKTLLWDNGLSRWYYVEVSGSVTQIGYTMISATESGFGLTDWVQTSSDVSVIWDQIVVRSYSALDTRTNVSDIVDIDVLLEYEFDDSSVTDGTVLINSVSAIYQGSGIWRISETRSSVASVVYNAVSCSGNTHGITNVNQNAQSLTIIWDQIVVGSYTVSDNHVNVDDVVNIDVALTFEFDSAFVTDGTVTINGISATHQGSGVWRITQTRSSVQSVSFNTVSCYGNLYGIAIVDQNSQSQDIIWDQIVVQSYTVLDNRVNIDDSVNIDFVLHYGFDDSFVADGSASINAISAIYQGSGVWRIIDSKSSVQLVNYDTVVCSGNSFGISSVDQNSQSEAIIWDQIVVRSYSIDDSRIDLDTLVFVNVTLEYEYDDTSVVNGVVIIQSVSAMHVGNGIWQISMSKSSVQMVSFDSVVCSGNLHGISNVDQNGQQLDVIWDKITVRSYTVIDSRVNVDASVNVDVLVEYEYDNSPVTDGIITINGASASHQGAGVWRITDSQSTIQIVTYDLIVSSGNLHGISLVDQNGQSHSVIWDQIVVQSYSILDNRVNVDSTVSIDVVLIYDYDDSPVIDGIVTINGIVASHQGSGTWRFTDVKSSVQAFTYDAASCSGNTNGITSVDQGGQSLIVIWDQIIVRSYAIDDSRVETDVLVTINVTLEFEYDDSDVANGAVIIQSVSASYAGNGIWQITMSKSSVQSVQFDTVVCSGNVHGISSVNQNGQVLTVIWDQITIRSYSVTDSRVNVDDSVNIDVLVEYDYDDTPVTDGSVTINGVSATPEGAGVWRITDSRSSVQAATYNLVTCSGNSHGISVVDQNSQSHTVIWDQIVVQSYSVLDTRVDVDVTVSFDVTLSYDYDDSPVTDGSVVINSIAAAHQGNGIWRFSDVKSSVQAFTYDTVACSGNTHGITNVDQNGQSEAIIWDQIIVRSYLIEDSHVEIGVLVTINVTLEYDYDDSDVVNGVVLIQSVSATHAGNGVWQITMVKSSVQSVTFDSVICSGNSLDITSVNQNAQELIVIWDKITVRSYTVIDSRVNVGDEVNISVLVQYEYDDTPVTDGTVTINGYLATHIGLGVWQINDTKSSVQAVPYNLVTCSGNSHGISVVDQNSQSHTVIWDRIQVLTTSVDDTRLDTDTSCEIRVTLMLEYDSTPLGLGDTVTLNGDFMVWDEADSRFELTQQQSLVGEWTYFVNSSFETTFGISALNLDSNEISVIWDQIIVRSYSVEDSHVEIGILVTINVTLEYDYDDSDVVNGVVLIQSVSATHAGNGVWQITMVKSSVQSVTFDSVICSGNPLGISSVNQNGHQLLVIWDKITVRSYTVTDSRVNVGDEVNISVLVQYEYEDTPVTDGTVTINGADASNLGAGVWRITDSRSSVQAVSYNLVTCSGNSHGISVVDQNSQSHTVIWDQIVVISYQVLDIRVDIADIVNVEVVLQYEYDNTDVYNGSVQINGVAADYQGSGVWRISVSELTVGANTYNITTCAGNTHDISTVDQNGQSITVIWDQITVRSLTASDDRDNIGSTITVSITLEYEFDDSDVIDGLVIVNSLTFTYTGANGIWEIERLQNSITSETFDTAVVSGNNLAITEVDQNGLSLTIIWDRIRILTTIADDSRLNTDSTARIMVTAELEYDGVLLTSGDALFIDNGVMTWDAGNGWFYVDVSKSAVGLWSYYVNSTGALQSTFGISEITIAGLAQDVIWDELSITITPDATSVNDFVTVNFALAVTYSYDDATCTSYIVDIGRNATNWLSFTNLNVSQFMDDNIALTYQYSTIAVTSESSFGITVFTTNTVEVTWSTPGNFAPFNNGAPTLLNPDDSDNMYSRLRQYFITSSFVDYDGFADVDYVELSLWDNLQLFEVWRVRFTSVTQTFSIIFGSEYIQLSSSSSNFSSGYLLNVTWSIKIDWDHSDLQNIDVRQFVIDSGALSDMDWYESDWDVETRLDYSTMASLSDNHGDVGTVDLQASGKVIYYGSGSLLSPLANETDVWVRHDFSGSWSGNVSADGSFSISGIGSSSLVRLNTYTFKIVEAGLGPSSADLFYTTSPTGTFITDRIEFYISGVDDSRINIGEMSDVWWRARYEYSGADIQSGLSAYLNGINLLTWDTINSCWHYQEARTSPMQILYQISSASESDLGITNWLDSATNQTVIWDSLIISITDPFDQRTNVNTNATGITVSAKYGYDSAPFDGTILLDNTTFQFSSVHRQYYTAASAFGDTHGINVISINDQTWCIWDQIEVVSILSNITYLDPNEYARVQVFLLYDFDDAPVLFGNFSLKFEELVHLADGIWEANVTRLSYQMINFDTLTTCEATEFGITHFDLYGNSLAVFWDRLEVYDSSAADSRIDVGSTGFSQWSVRLQNAGIDITSGIIAHATGSATLTFVDGYWQGSHTSAVVGVQTFTILSASFEGIDFFVSNTNDVSIIWDRIQVLTTSTSSSNPAIEQFIIISVTLSYEYDGTEVTDGVVTLWDQDSQITMSYNASGGFWYANITKINIGEYTFYVEAVSGNQYGITGISLDGNQITIEFVPPPLPRLTPMMIAGISSGFIFVVAIIGILVRRRYQVITPHEVEQILNVIEAIEQGEIIEVEDIRSLQRTIFDELELGYQDAGWDLPETLSQFEVPLPEVSEMETLASAVPDEFLFDPVEPAEVKIVGDLKIADSEDALEEIHKPELEEDAVIDIPPSIGKEEILEVDVKELPEVADVDDEEVTEIDFVEGLFETDGIDVGTEPDKEGIEQLELEDKLETLVEPDADTPVEDADISLPLAETAEPDTELDISPTPVTHKTLSEIIEETYLLETAVEQRIPLTVADWIEKMPDHVSHYFFEEELRELDLDELEMLSLMTREEIQSLVDGISSAKDSDSIDPVSSTIDISDGLKDQKKQFEEAIGDDQQFKQRLLQLIPAFVREFLTDELLLQLSHGELEQLSLYSEPDLKALIDTLTMKTK